MANVTDYSDKIRAALDANIETNQGSLRTAIDTLRKNSKLPLSQDKLAELAGMSRSSLRESRYRFAVLELNALKALRKQEEKDAKAEKQQRRASLKVQHVTGTITSRETNLQVKLEAQRSRSVQYWNELEDARKKLAEWEQNYAALLGEKLQAEKDRDAALLKLEDALRRLGELPEEPSTGEDQGGEKKGNVIPITKKPGKQKKARPKE